MGYDGRFWGTPALSPIFTICNCMMSFVEVEVDTGTGKVTLLRVVLATDVGQIIDPQGLEGSSTAASVLRELTAPFLKRRSQSLLRTHPQCEPDRLQVAHPLQSCRPWSTWCSRRPFPTHRFQAVGVGEIATSPGPSAVLMAVSNAVGTWLHEYPVTPDRVLRALANAAMQKWEERDEVV